MTPPEQPRNVFIYLGCPKEIGGVFQYARTVLHSLVSGLPDDRHLIAVSPLGTEWGPICRQYGVEFLEVEDMRFTDRVMGKVLRAMGGSRPPRRLMSKVTPLGRLLAEREAAVCVYTNTEHFSYELSTPSLIPVHDLMHRYERFDEDRNYVDPDRIYRMICHGASGILVDSETGRHQVLESYGPAVDARMHVLPLIAPDYVYDPSLLDSDPHLEQMLSSVPSRFFFYPAQFWAHKNHIRLVDAVMGAARRFPDVHLVLAGSPKNNYEAVVSHIEVTGASGHVTMLGFISDAAKMELYRRARALVMPTFHGTSNIPPLEAIQVGCPVALSLVYGHEEQLGDAAAFFDPSSTDEMQKVLERLWNDDDYCAELVHNGTRRAAKWGPPQFSARLWEIIETTIEAA